MRLLPFLLPKLGLSVAKWLIKKVWIKCKAFLSVVLHKQAIMHCSINSISRLISSHDHNSTDQEIAMNRYYSDFRKLDNFFSGKQRLAKKIYSRFICDFIYDFLLSKEIQSSYITFVISNNSTFFGTTENKWKITINFDNT